MKNCPQCGTQLPREARFCFQCGAPQPEPVRTASGNGETINWSEPLSGQFNEYFLQQLRQYVTEFFGPDVVNTFTERLYESGFRDVVYRRLDQLAQRLAKARLGMSWNRRHSERELEGTCYDLFEFFLVHHCSDLSPVHFPESILSHQEESWAGADLFQLVLDYLDFGTEPLQVYTDFILMPKDKLRNAARSFLFPDKEERILLICDQTLLGSFKAGFALTDAALYWKPNLQEPQVLHFQSLRQLENKRSYLLLNGHFFDVNPEFNLKMLLLLHKLRRMQPLIP